MVTACDYCGDRRDYYMVRDEVWREAGLESDEQACIECLEKRLDRKLCRADFTNYPVNQGAFIMSATHRDRLARTQKGGA